MDSVQFSLNNNYIVDGRWSPVVFASCSLTPAERRYAQIEKEALPLTWSYTIFQDYLIGLTFTLETDHKPLVPLLGTAIKVTRRVSTSHPKNEDERFSYVITHVPGKELYTEDTLSRAHPSQKQRIDDDDLTE